MFIYLCLAIFFFVFSPLNCCFAGEEKGDNMGKSAMSEALMQDIERSWPLSSQIIVVKSDGPASRSATLHVMEKKEGGWEPALESMKAMIGRNGFAPAGEKREGDGRTPTGVFPLGYVFGYEKSVQTRMSYRQMTDQDIWVDDPDAVDYNRLTKKGKTTAKSFEEMVLPDDRYKYGIVVEYNTDPVAPGLGSAIFIHVWKDGETATSGCIALSEKDILKLIRWIGPAEHPLVSLGN